MTCKSRKILYGLKQAPWQWYRRFDSFMVSQNYTKINGDHCVYVRHFFEGNFIILLFYVDDMLTVEQYVDNIHKLKVDLYKPFDMKDLDHAN